MTQSRMSTIALSRRVSWIATAGAIVLAILPGLSSLLHGHLGEYDPTLAVLTATLVGLIWSLQFTFETLHHSRTRDQEERVRSRMILATALLSEFEWIDGILEQIRLHGPYSHYDPLAHPVFEGVLANASLFSAATGVELARFQAMLRDVQAGVNAWRTDPTIFGERGSPDYYESRRAFKLASQAKAHFALDALPRLVDALIGEGGTLPAPVATPSLDPTRLPPPPPSRFGRRRLS